MSSKHNVAVLCSSETRTTAIAQVLQSGNVDALVCGSSDEFCQAVRRQRVDAIIVEHELSGFLTGLDIIERLLQDLLRPVVILLTQDVTAIQGRKLKVRMDAVLSTDTEPEQIAETLKSSLLAMTHVGVKIPHEARALVRDADYVPPMPQLLVRLSKYLNDDNASIGDLTNDLSTDPRITAELLKLVNSSKAGMRSKVTRVFDAVNLLGIKRTVSIVLSASVVGSQQKFLQTLPEWFDGWFRPRNVLIGATASAFASRLTQLSADTAYVLGLLQNLGILLMARTIGGRYLKLLERSRSVGHLQLAVMEQQEYQFSHAAVSAALYQRWELPPSIIRMVLEHHTLPGEYTCSETEQRFLTVMQIGEAVADLHDVACPQRHAHLGRLFRVLDGSDSETCKSCLAVAVAKTREFSDLFTSPVPDARELQNLIDGISLQVIDNPQAAAADPAGSNGAAAQAIVVVEDDEGVVDVFREYLQPLGVEVLHAHGSEEAVAAAGRAAAVVCDVHLKQEHGTDVVRNLRLAGCELPVLMISGDCTRSTVLDCIAAGISDFMVKPISESKLLEKLRTHTSLRLDAGSETVPKPAVELVV